jgi:hypothetical protein
MSALKDSALILFVDSLVSLFQKLGADEGVV